MTLTTWLLMDFRWLADLRWHTESLTVTTGFPRYVENFEDSSPKYYEAGYIPKDVATATLFMTFLKIHGWFVKKQWDQLTTVIAYFLV